MLVEGWLPRWCRWGAAGSSLPKASAALCASAFATRSRCASRSAPAEAWAGTTKSQGTSKVPWWRRSEEHTSELQSRPHLVCRLLLEKKKKKTTNLNSKQKKKKKKLT